MSLCIVVQKVDNILTLNKRQGIVRYALGPLVYPCSEAHSKEVCLHSHKVSFAWDYKTSGIHAFPLIPHYCIPILCSF